MTTIADILHTFHPEMREKYDFSEAQYTRALTPIENIRCPKHGPFKQYSAQLRKNGAGCPKCGAEKRVAKAKMPQHEFLEKVNTIHGGKYDYSKTIFDKVNSKIIVTCPEHGDFSITANHHYYRKQGCPQCENEAKKSRIVQYRHLSAKAKIANTAVSFFDNCRVAHNGKYGYPEQSYRGAKEQIRIVCPVHGEFKQAAWTHLSGKGCFKCGAYEPKWEAEVADFVKGLGFCASPARRVLDGRDIDIYVENRNIGIELHGLHWHTEKTKPKQYHFEKWRAAKQAGIQLIQVFEDEWVSNKEVVLGRIRTALGIFEAYDARKTLLGVVSSSEADLFFDTYHTQGSARAKVVYGLRYNEEWVAMASFGLARTGAMTVDGGDSWEVIRYASKGRVRGGFSKLFKRFIADYSPNRVISYCDLRYGTGGLYEACGFTLDGITEPDYWWVPKGKVARVPRYQTQKHKLATHPVLKEFYDPAKTEVEICHAAGWYRIYGVGHQRWLWKAVDVLPTT